MAHDEGESTSFTLYSPEELVSELSLSEIKSELKKRGLSAKGKKAVLTERLIDILKQEEVKSSLVKDVQFEISPSLQGNAAHAKAGSSKESHPEVCSPKLSGIDLLRRKEKIMKMNVEAVIQVVIETSKSPGNNVIRMENRVQKLNTYWESCNEIRDEIIALLPDSELASEAEKWIEYQQVIDNALDIAREYLSKFSSKIIDGETAPVSAERKQSHLKLPKLELPKFHGDVLKFQNFWDQFEAAVDKNPDLPDVQKFTYLRSVLDGVAYHTIEGFEVTSANYHHAVDALKYRYGRKRIIISSLVKSIVQLEVGSVVEAEALRELHDTLKNRIRALDALGENPMIHSCILLPIFETKLPPKLSEKWELELTDVKEEDVNIEFFFKFLNKQVLSKEAGQRSTNLNVEAVTQCQSSGLMSESIAQNSAGKSGVARSTRERISTASALLASQTSQGSAAVCHMCRERGHEIAKCPRFKRSSIEERWQVVREHRLCFNCFKPANSFHFASVCRHPRCSAEGCGQRHHIMLHGENGRGPEIQVPTTISGFAASENTKVQQTLLQTAKATLVGGGDQRVPVRVLLDSGSQRSYITKKVAESLALQGPSEVLSVSMLGGESSQTKRMKRVSFFLTSVQGTDLKPMEALTIDKICMPLDPVELNLEKYPHLRNLMFADLYPRGSVDIDVLIGADYYFSFVTGNCVKGDTSNSPTAVESTFGWIVSGPIEGQLSKTSTSMLSTVRIDPVTASLKQFWELESIGIVDKNDAFMSVEEEDAVRQFNGGLKFDGERYVVPLLWKRDTPDLHSNYEQAVKRLESVERQLRRNPEKAEAYRSAINQYVEKGYAEEVKETDDQSKKVRYLPHHAVFREDKRTTKCRVVFDASAREHQDASLNDCILSGPALQPNLVSVLLRFRTPKIALMADVEKMFLQIKVDEKDQDVLRYVWRDLKSDDPPRIYRLQRLAFGVNCSPFLAIATVQHHAKECKEEFPAASMEVLSNMYVDDCLTGDDSVEASVELQKSLDKMMERGGFNLTKWASNSKEVLSYIAKQDQAQSNTIDFSESEPLKALGICWNTITDSFLFNVPQSVLKMNDPETKRSLLSIASRIFDPMGLLSPFTVKAKILFQDLWQRGLEWEDQLDEEVATQWRSWKSELPCLSRINIPRHFMADGRSIIELHGFGDASPKAYGAAVYIRSMDAAGKVSTHLVMSKSRVAPTKTVSLPRLELLAAVINSRLLKFVAESLCLKLDRVVCWTDSMVTLQWIRGSSSHWKTFVANRVAEIQSTWDPQHWKHCPGEDNPADLITRGLSLKVLAENSLWWNGPKWLASSCWPTERQRDEEPSEFVERERKPKQATTHTCAVLAKETVIEASRYEKWLTLIRVTAYVLRWVRVFKSKESSESRELSAEELKNAKLNWYRHIQREVYRTEYAQLEAGQPLPKTSTILKLDPYFDKEDRVLRVGGRLQYSDLPEATKHPIILPHGHPVVEKIIQSVHNELLHAGPENTLSALRQNIWLTHGRREVKRVLMKCLVCQRQRVGPSSQKMAPLPSERVLFSPPFTHVGIDFAGPLYVQGNSGPHKSYVCIFTCASSRMVHLELTSDLSTNTFLQAFNRMISRRGLCSTIWSDNAKTFKSADRQIRKLYKSQSPDSDQPWNVIDQNELQTKLSSKGIKWKFIVERSPWRGGWWERLIRNVKEPLRKVLGKALLSYAELTTVLTRIEAVINTRPLTTVSDDVRDPTPITPAHLALGRSLFDLPDLEEVSVNEDTTRQRYLYQQRLVNHFWKRWRGEYLHQLSIRPKWNEEQPALSVGDVVLISEDNVSRGKWPMGRVEKLFPGKDGLVRTVELKTQKGNLCRPIQRLHRLEASNQSLSAECYDGEAHGGESKNKVKESTGKKRSSQVVSGPNGNLRQRRKGGEDVPARTRSGRVIRAPKRLDI